MKQPRGFVDAQHSNLVCKLHPSYTLYEQPHGMRDLVRPYVPGASKIQNELLPLHVRKSKWSYVSPSLCE